MWIGFALRHSSDSTEAVSATDPDTAFEAAFRLHYAQVWGVAVRLVASDAAAEDLAQEAFLRLYGSSVLRRPETEVRSWLLRVVTNLALNATRGRRREQARLERVGRLELAESAARAVDEEPGRLAERDEERRLVRQVLLRLPPRARACLVLRYSGMSYAEIAEAVGIAPGSVGTTLARAERAFRVYWEHAEGRRDGA